MVKFWVPPKLQAHDHSPVASADESVTSDARARNSNLTSTIQPGDWQIPTKHLITATMKPTQALMGGGAKVPYVQQSGIRAL